MFNDSSILITGGTGSFGRKYVHTLLRRYKPRRVVVYSRDELKQYEMQQDYNHPSMRYFIGDVRDADRLRRGAGARRREQVPDRHLLRGAEADRVQILGVHLEEGQIGQGVNRDDLGVLLGAVAEPRRHPAAQLARLGQDVPVGEHDRSEGDVLVVAPDPNG